MLIRKRITILVAVCLLALSFAGKAETFTYVDSLDVKKHIVNTEDTIWFVNYNFNENIRTEVILSLKFINTDGINLTGCNYDLQQISPYTGADTVTGTNYNCTGTSVSLTDNFMTFPEWGEGVYQLTFHFPNEGTDGKDIIAFVFNKKIEFDIIPVKMDRDVCISKGCDTCIFTLQNHRYNPKGTQYKMSSMTDIGDDIVVDEEKPENVQDSFWIIYNGPTGVDPMLVSVTGVFVNQRNKKTIQETKAWTESIRKFDKPNLPKIFGFDTTNMEDLIGCSEFALSGMTYNEDLNRKYMDDMETPDFETKTGYTLRYYWKNQLEAPWEELTEADKERLVKDSTSFIFHQSGLFLIRMEAENMCGKDTLNTEAVFDKESGTLLPQKRLIKVYGNDIKTISFEQAALCLGEDGTDTLRIKDRARRYDWEGEPAYQFIVRKILKDQSGTDSLAELSTPADVYEEAEREVFEAADGNGVDSLEFSLVFKKAGLYQVTITKQNEGHCNMVSDSLRLNVGKVPEFSWEMLKDADGFPSKNKYLCGAYLYQLPLTLGIDSSYMALEEFEWKFGKGKYVEIYSDRRPVEEFTFDSLGGSRTPSYITFRVKNKCGWSHRDSVPFYTELIPQVTLWRDSIPDNDTLCANVKYDYHFKGIFPEQFKINNYTQNDSTIRDLTFSPPTGSNPSQTFTERFIIVNTGSISGCRDTVKMGLTIIRPPVIEVLDTVHFCKNSVSEIRTSDLMTASGYQVLRWEILKPESGFSLTEQPGSDFPTVGVADEMVLGYYISAGGNKKGTEAGGCYIKGEIALFQHAEPELTLNRHEWVSCEGEILDVGVPMVTTVDQAQHLQVSIGNTKWYPNEDGTTGLKNYTCVPDKDSVTIRYEALQLHNYPNVDGCSLEDSVKLYITHPQILFTKDRDTLFDVNLEYHFDRMESHTDTADVVDLMWGILENNIFTSVTSATDPVFEKTYDFTGKPADAEYLFVLKGESLCGKEVTDTMTVFYPGSKLVGGNVAICSNVEDLSYNLWSEQPDGKHVSGYFVDGATLNWSLEAGPGQIEGSGKNARYVLSGLPQADKTTISVTASDVWNNHLGEVKFSITFQKPPHLEIKGGAAEPFVLAEKDTLFISEIAEVRNARTHKWKGFSTVGGGTVLNPNAAAAYVPAYELHNGVFRDSIQIAMGNKRDDICPDFYYDTLKLLVHAAPKVAIEKDTLRMCTEEELTIGTPDVTTVEVKADVDVNFSWETASACSDCLNSLPGFQVIYRPGLVTGWEKVYLRARKQVVNYRGITRELFAQDSVNVQTQGEPHFVVRPGRDTLCHVEERMDLNDFEISTLENYPLVYTPGPGFQLISGSAYQLVSGVDSAKIYVRADIRECNKWVDKRDSLVVVRLPELVASVTPASTSVCDNGTLNIQGNTNTANFEWQTRGGRLTGKEGLTPVYHPVDGVLNDEIILKVKPLLNRCTDSKQASVAITVVPRPVLKWKDDTICNSEDRYVLTGENINAADIRKIQWTCSSATGHFVDPDVLAAEYVFSEEDRHRGELTFTARIRLKDPCGEEEIVRRMKLTILQIPVLQVDETVLPSLCQGDSLDLNLETQPLAGKYQWFASTGTWRDAQVAHPRYYANGNAGSAELSVVLTSVRTGSYVCVSEPQVFHLGVKEAPLPELNGSTVVCQEGALTFTTSTVADVYSWRINRSEAGQAQELNWRFLEAGQQEVVLGVEYNNQCRRSTSHTVSVLPRPEAKFKADSTIVGINKTIRFTNQSEDIVRQWWYVEDTNVADDADMNYEFPASGAYQVWLEVENSDGCRDTSYQELRAILKPMADFTVTLEDPDKPCDGSLALFENHSQGEKAYLAYRWILNTVKTGVDTTAEIPVGDIRYAASRYQDTVYQVGLIVSNAAGADTAYREVKILSRIQTQLELVNGSSLCAGFDKEFMNYTTGAADWYTIDWGDGQDTTFTVRGNHPAIRHKYANATYEMVEHTVKLCAGNVCEENCAETVVKVKPNSAVAKIKIDEQVGAEGCYMFDAVFHNISAGFGGFRKALWDFGEGDPLVENNEEKVQNLYEKPGDYRVILKIFDECNESTDTVYIRVKGDDRLAFRVLDDHYCSGQTLQMQVIPGLEDQFYEYSWNFDAHNPNSAWIKQDSTKVHRKFKVGTYRIALKAKSLDGCEVYYPYYQDVTVQQTPFADLEFRYDGEQNFRNRKEPLEGCDPLKVELKAIGLKPDDQVFWQFADGGISQEPVLQHHFVHTGNTGLRLRVKSANGCADSLMKDVLVKESPEADFVNRPGTLFCADGNIHVDVANTGAGQEHTTYLWSYRRPEDADYVFWDDKTIPAKLDFEQLYGQLILKLKATHQQSGCWMEKTDTLISSLPMSNRFRITKEMVCDGEDIHFEFLPNEGDQVVWELGDQSLPLDQTEFSYVYEEPGKYDVKLTVQNKYGCQQDTIRTVQVNPLPEARFDYEEDRKVVENLPGVDLSQLPDIPTGGIRFYNNSRVDEYDFTIGQLSSRWDFGDGTAEVREENPSHHFDNNGQYGVTLYVQTEHGCADSVLHTVSIDAVKGLFIPNAFAPGAGVEENPGVALFQPKGIGLISYKIQVYDPDSGTCVWMSDKLDNGRPAEAWDGTFNGQLLPKKVYTWKIAAVFIDGTVWAGEDGSNNGMVILIR